MEIDIKNFTLEEVLSVSEGKAPCSICVIQNTCTWAGKCEKYQEYKRKREKRK